MPVACTATKINPTMKSYALLKISAILIVSVLVFHLLPSTARGQDYLVGAGDLLKITVYGHPDLETQVRVGGDGKITFPLIGEVEVAGLTSNGIERKIVLLVEDGYIKNAHVTVFIAEYKSKKVTVLGEFSRPGIIKLTGEATLLEVISDAGGVTPDAGDLLYIKRKSIDATDGENEVKDISVTVDLKRLLEGGDVDANVKVKDGDSIYVPRASFVFVSGEVSKPGAYKITKDLTVLKAITLAGGFTIKAWRGRTKIIHKNEDGSEVTVRAKMDDVVSPDDIILVPESFF